MLFKMIRGVLFHQRGKMLLIAFTIALGASLATGMLNVITVHAPSLELLLSGDQIVQKKDQVSILRFV